MFHHLSSSQHNACDKHVTKFCHNKRMRLSQQNTSFIKTQVCLVCCDKIKFCHDKHTFAAAKHSFFYYTKLCHNKNYTCGSSVLPMIQMDDGEAD